MSSLLRDLDNAFGLWGYLLLACITAYFLWRHIRYSDFQRLLNNSQTKLNELGRELPDEIKSIRLRHWIGLAAALPTIYVFVMMWIIGDTGSYFMAIVGIPYINLFGLYHLDKKYKLATSIINSITSQSNFFNSTGILASVGFTEDKSLTGKLSKALETKKEKEKKAKRNKKAEDLTHGILACLEATGEIQAFDLIDDIYFCKNGFLEEFCEETTQELLTQAARKQSAALKIDALLKIVVAKSNLEKDPAFNLVSGYFTKGKALVKKGEFFYYTEEQLSRTTLCECCGQVADENNQIESNGNIFCSDTCKTIYNKLGTEEFQASEKFVAACKSINYAVTARTAIAVGVQYAENQKLFSIGGQGHGFIAEKANTYHDRLTGKDAVILGNDNAKSGPDRLVDGQLIQTKYCKTAARSVGAMFDGQEGPWKYTYKDENGLIKIMPVEIPKDQYEPAINELKKKIAAGRVPGITSQEEAEKLIIKGSITYEQAKNATRFGTIEGLIFDATESIEATKVDTSISFLVSFSHEFWRTRDPKKACEAAVVSAITTFTKQTTTSILVQQLHRTHAVQTVVNSIAIPASMNRFLAKTLNIGEAQVPRHLGGAMLAGGILALSASKDIYHLINNEISAQQLLKNTTIKASGVAGGAAGAIAGSAVAGRYLGGTLGSFAGPVGSFLGAALVGHLATMATQSFLDKHIENDRAKLDKLVRHQIKYMADQYLMTAEEIQIVTDAFFENQITIVPNENSSIIINSIILPHIVYLAKNRPHVYLSEYESARNLLLQDDQQNN